jgi:hypothetical protein
MNIDRLQFGGNLLPKMAAAFGALMMLAWHAPVYAAATGVRASGAGAHLDSDLMKGGGTDDTAVLQSLLDGATEGRPVHLVIDGPALVSGLNVHGNTTIECTAGGGLYLKDQSSRAIIRNAHRSRGGILDEHIEIRGCFLNGNRNHQPSADIGRPDLPGFTGTSNKERDGTFLSGLQFLGVNYLTIKDVTLWNVRAFGALIANASYVDIHNVIVDHGAGPGADVMEYLQTDGLHFKGPLQYVSIDSVKLRVGDDSIAFNANDFETNDITTRNDFGPYVGQGPIRDVTVTNVTLMQSLHGIRVLSTNERIDRILISNVVGTVKDYLLNIGHWMNPGSFGNIGQITIDNINVDRPSAPPVGEQMAFRRENRVWYGEDNEGNTPLININGRIETLQIHHFATKVVNSWPILRIGPDAAVGTMDIDLSAYDPSLLAHILQLDEGGRVERLNLSLKWQGAVTDQGKNPLIALGGTVGQLDWIATPPLYVGANLIHGNKIAVTFSQDIRAVDYQSGVRLKVNGKPVGILRTERRPGRADVVSYVVRDTVRDGDTVTWAYDAALGTIQNLSGIPMHSVSEKNSAPPGDSR